MRNCMDVLSMNYFEGVNFIFAGYFPNYSLFCTRRFKDYYGIQYSQDGKLRVEMGPDFKRTVSGPWALITRPGPVFRFGAPPRQKRLHACVCFNGPKVDAYVKSGLLPMDRHNPLMRITRPERFCATLRRLIALLQPLSPATHDRATHMLEDVLLQLHEQPADSVICPVYLRPKFDALVAAINADPTQQDDFPAAADAMHISYPHFRRLFRQYSGLAPGKFLMRARLRHAAEQLVGADDQLKDIAARCGFDDNLYFSRMFKKYYRMSPRRYRIESQG